MPCTCTLRVFRPDDPETTVFTANGGEVVRHPDLSVHLHGSPDALRDLADRLQHGSAGPIPLAGGSTVRLRRVEARPLRLSIVEGPTLLAEATEEGLGTLIETLRSVADTVDVHGWQHSVPYTRSIEYLGSATPWISERSNTVVVSSSGPQRPGARAS